MQPEPLKAHAFRLRPGQDLKMEIQAFADREQIERHHAPVRIRARQRRTVQQGRGEARIEAAEAKAETMMPSEKVVTASMELARM